MSFDDWFIEEVILPPSQTKFGLFCCGEHEFIGSITSMKKKLECPLCQGWKYLYEYDHLYQGEHEEEIPTNLNARLEWQCYKCEKLFKDKTTTYIRHSGECATCFPRRKSRQCMHHEEMCKSEAVFNLPSEKIPLRCAKHKLPEMIDIKHKRCQFSGCNTRPNYGEKGKSAQYCAEHKLPGMADVTHGRCRFDGCKKQPTYGEEGKSAQYCAEHKLPGMIDVKSKRCQFSGCNTKPTYGEEGESAQYCAEHKLPGMIDVINKRCQFSGCNTRPSYGEEGESAQYCLEHKLPGMIDVINKRCQFSGCEKQPSYGKEGKSAQYCLEHKLPGMIDVINKRCQFSGCGKYPSYGEEGKSAQYCLEHKLPGMVDVKSKRCQSVGCGKYPSYGEEGKSAQYCLEHKLPGMVDVKSKRCQFSGCNTRASYGYIGKLLNCAKHKAYDMIKNPHKRCITGDCDEFACYGKKHQTHCAHHKLDGQRLMTSRTCKNANDKSNFLCLKVGILNDKELCRECDPAGHYNYRRNEKELEIKEWLEQSEHGDFQYHDKTLPEFHECFGRRYRPDFLYTLIDRNVVLECDENQHRGKPYECDRNRVVEIGQSFGGAPTIFIRHNPDGYITDGKRHNPTKRKRKKQLLEAIGYFKKCRLNSHLAQVKLFYDGYRDMSVAELPIEEIDYVEEAKE